MLLIIPPIEHQAAILGVLAILGWVIGAPAGWLIRSLREPIDPPMGHIRLREIHSAPPDRFAVLPALEDPDRSSAREAYETL